MQRRAQKPITIRSNRAAGLLAQHTRTGRSQVAVIEEALERLPLPANSKLLPEEERQQFIAAIKAITARTSKRRLPTMAEFDAREYDERGNPQ